MGVSPDFASVSLAVANCATGGTVNINAGTATWQSTNILTFSKDISIIGAGMDEAHATPTGANATIITCQGPQAINATYQGTENVCRLSGIVFEITARANNKYLINLNGKCYRRRSSGNVVGGIRMDHLRIRNTADTAKTDYILASTISSGSQTLPIATFNVASTAGFTSSGQFIVSGKTVNYTNVTGSSFTGCTGGTGVIAAGTAVSQVAALGSDALIFVVGGPTAGSGAGNFITGSFDNNFIDYIVGTVGSEVNSFACAGSPDGLYGDGFGEYQWEQNYTYGGGDDTELNVLYVEDNIFHRNGFNFGTLAGGGRYIIRYNTSWGGLTTHGIDGGNMGPASTEFYNNWIWNRGGSGFPCCNTRGGTSIYVNNRFTTATADMEKVLYRPASASSFVIGPASGRNFLDDNYTGTIGPFANGDGTSTFAPVRGGSIKDETNDPRLGSVYANGGAGTVTVVQAGKKYTLTGLDGGTTANKWRDFVIVNTTVGGDGSTGDQGVQSGQVQGYINSSTTGASCTVTVQGGANTNFGLVAGQAWEIRRPRTFFCSPGSGKLTVHSNGGANGQGTSVGFSLLTANTNGQFKYWSSQPGFGMWNKYNLTRPTPSTDWGDPSVTDPTIVPVVGALTFSGGMNDDLLPGYRKNDAFGGGLGDPYPQRSNNSNTGRIGAHWNAPGFTEGIDYGATGGIIQAYGAAWPNALVSGTVALPPVITSALTASATVGTAFTYTITASNSPIVFGIGSSLLPSGLGINTNTGVISGTPDGQPGTYTITITAANSAGQGNASLVLTVSGLGSGKRGKGVARRVASGSRRI